MFRHAGRDLSAFARGLLACVVMISPVRAERSSSPVRQLCSFPRLELPRTCKSPVTSNFFKATDRALREHAMCLFDDGNYPELFLAVDRYWTALVAERVDDIVVLLSEEDLGEREQRLDELRSFVDREDLIAYKICALNTYEEASTAVFSVGTRILATSEGLCVDNVVFINWILTDSGWRVQPSKSGIWRPIPNPGGEE